MSLLKKPHHAHNSNNHILFHQTNAFQFSTIEHLGRVWLDFSFGLDQNKSLVFEKCWCI